MKPIISLLASAHRTDLWLDWYKSIGDNQISFEVIFVGPNKPDFQLPDNFYFIESHVKPPQCWEIAARRAEGKYLLFLGDDVFFNLPDYISSDVFTRMRDPSGSPVTDISNFLAGVGYSSTPNPLDTLYTNFLSYNTEKLMLSCRLVQILTDITRVYDAACHRPSGSYSKEVILPVGFMITADYYRYLGGCDINFIGLYWDLDLCFRVIEDEGITKLGNVWLVEDTRRSHPTQDNSLYMTYGIDDREKTLQGLWPMFNIHTEFKRSAILEPYIDTNILTKSQGPKGKWV